ncbi:hypothetical protein O9992_02955 [Vibrio lentus]|nr:hypothetical protein [Vibrio lentus]
MWQTCSVVVTILNENRDNKAPSRKPVADEKPEEQKAAHSKLTSTT